LDGEIDNEERGEDVQEPVHLARLASQEGQKHVRDEAESQARRDGEGERHQEDGQEGGDGDREFPPVDLAEDAAHQHPDQDQRRRGRLRGDRGHDGRKERREEEAGRDDDGGEPRAAAGVDPGSALDVGRGVGGAQKRADHGPQRVGDESAAPALQAPLLVDHPCAPGDAHERPDRVEKVHEEEGEDGDEERRRQSGEDVELEEARGQGGRQVGQEELARRELRDHLPAPGRDEESDRSRDEDADQDGAGHLADQEDTGKEEAEQGQKHARSAHPSEADEGGRVVHDDAGVLEPDEGDEEPDAGADRGLEIRRDRLDDRLPYPGQGDEQGEAPGEEHRAHGDLPGEAHPLAQPVGEESVEAHPGGEGEGIVREEPHDEGGERGGEAGRHHHGAEVHAGPRVWPGERQGVHDDDVGHRDEGGQAGDHLGADAGFVLREAEEGVQLPL